MAMAIGTGCTLPLLEVSMWSWQTSLTGLCLIVLAVFNAIKTIVDGNPTTNPDWNIAIAEIVTGIGLIFARDNNKSSQMLKVGPKT